MMVIEKVFVYGAGGHGKVVADILLARKDPRFAGFIDDRAALQGATVLGFPICGDGRWLQHEAGTRRVSVALGIGDNFARQRVAGICLGWGAELLTLVHPTAAISTSVHLGPGAVVMAQAAINPDAKIGSGAIVNTAASVDHDAEVGEFAHVGPKAALGGASHLGALSFLGIGAVVIHCVAVGARCIVGAGAVVAAHVPDSVVAIGVPARVHRRL
jgi:sugar O-acyltransferase (sialic acid O-acetyltransferase NeuD family)